MVGGFGPAPGGPQVQNYEGRVTWYLIVASIIVATGGYLFGYDLGISGGVTSMDDFLEKFFPTVYRSEQHKKNGNYCRYSNQGLQLFTSSLYLAGSFASFFASYVTRVRGRKLTITIGGVCFLIGAILNAAALNLSMLIIGRIFLGFGIGFAVQAVPLYLSEMAPPNWRGCLSMTFQSLTTIGILSANLINYGTGKMVPNGWRISLGLAGVPATILTLGGIFLPDTPNSLVERGHDEKARMVLQKVRGVKNVEIELNDLRLASRISNSVKSPWRTLVKRRYRPQLVMALCIPAFQQFTGVNAITFYAPILFRSIGFGGNSALLSAVILGVAKVLGVWVAMPVVDRWGRKRLYYQGGFVMAGAQMAVGIILMVKLGDHGSISHNLGVLVIVFICVFEAGFEWSWGPLSWLVPSEIFPLQIRSAAMSVTVTSNFIWTFFIGQIFLTMFCSLKADTFIFFTGWLLFMTLFQALLIPETQNIPLEEMVGVWEKHWFWKHYVRDSSELNHDHDNMTTLEAQARAIP